MNAVHTEFRRLRRQHPHLSAHQALVDARRAERELRQYRQYLESGRVTISFIEAKIPASCPHCCGQLHGWQITAALGGIEDHHHADSASYLREVRRELALEAGVIE